MSEQLIIRLPADAESDVPWLVLSAAEGQGEVIASGTLSSLAALSEIREHAVGRDLRVLVASSAVSMHLLELPAKSRRHLQQVVPYALEDELAQEIEALHFCWPELPPAGEMLPVAVVAHQQMALWLDALNSAQLQVKALYPDFFALPEIPGHWSAAAFGDDIVVRESTWQGLSIHRDWLRFSAVDTDTQPEAIQAFGAVEWPESPVPVLESEVDLPLQMAARLDTRVAINLRQGSYQLKEGSQFNLALMKWPAIAATLLLTLFLLDKAAYTYQLNREANHLQASITATYLQVFPNESRLPPDARVRLEREVARLTGGQQGGLLLLLQDLAPAFQAGELQLTVMQYDHGRGELRIQANGSDFQVFERFQNAARNQQLEVEQGQIVSRGGQVAGNLVIRRGS
ncbi:MAG: type II secretion system protein GspL [Idiomarina sp.]|nr:type II secretion system protein GspL [Idiomarina sp.]